MPSESHISILAFILLGGSLALFYQSCAPTSTALKDRGVMGGSIHVTVSSQIYDYNFGKVDQVALRFDDQNNVKYIDLLSPQTESLTPLQQRMAQNQKFVIIIVNGHLNPGVLLKLNEHYYFAVDYQKMTEQFINGDHKALPIWTPAKLKTAKLIWLDEALTDNKLMSSRVDCVVTNHPGPHGEYRNAALVLQALGTDLMSFDPLTKSSGKTAKMLWELSAFQENKAGKCN